MSDFVNFRNLYKYMKNISRTFDAKDLILPKIKLQNIINQCNFNINIIILIKIEFTNCK